MPHKKIITLDELHHDYMESWPGIVNWKDCDYRMLGINELGQKFCQYESIEEIIGFRDHDLAWSDTADIYCAQDHYVMQGNYNVSIDAPKCNDGVRRITFTQKLPLVEYEKIVGVAILALPIPYEQVLSLPHILMKLSGDYQDSRFHNQTRKTFCYKELSFSYREAQCLSLLLRGYTTAEIAEKLVRSPRTIERNFDSLREKLGSTKRSVVFEKSIEYGFIELMFMMR